MESVNLFNALKELGGPHTKEDIIIQVAKTQNIRFNDFPQLQKMVDLALEQSQRNGFVDRQGTMYRLSSDIHSATAPKQTKSMPSAERSSNQGQGDVSNKCCTKPASLCNACSVADPKDFNNLNYNLLPNDGSVGSLCSFGSEVSDN